MTAGGGIRTHKQLLDWILSLILSHGSRFFKTLPSRGVHMSSQELNCMKHLDPANRKHFEGYIRHLELEQLKPTTIHTKVWRILALFRDTTRTLFSSQETTSKTTSSSDERPSAPSPCRATSLRSNSSSGGSTRNVKKNSSKTPR